MHDDDDVREAASGAANPRVLANYESASCRPHPHAPKLATYSCPMTASLLCWILNGRHFAFSSCSELSGDGGLGERRETT